MKPFSLLFLVILLTSCVTREEIEASIWKVNFGDSMKELCERNPEIAQHGFYRKLNNGKIEFMSICNSQAVHFVAIPEADFNRIMDQNLPKKQDPQN